MSLRTKRGNITAGSGLNVCTWQLEYTSERLGAFVLALKSEIHELGDLCEQAYAGIVFRKYCCVWARALRVDSAKSLYLCKCVFMYVSI